MGAQQSQRDIVTNMNHLANRNDNFNETILKEIYSWSIISKNFLDNWQEPFASKCSNKSTGIIFV